MERLTIHNGMYSRLDPVQVEEIYKKLAAYEDTGLEPEEVKEITSWSYGPFHKKMGDWLKAEQEGRLVVLPCKVGDTVYQKDYCGNIYEAIIQRVVIKKRRTVFITSGIDFDETAVGRTVFLTRAEAEKALEVSEK